jgi:hypothetical protein
MKLRSGKKKRRRSRETTGLTPPDQAEKKKRRLLGKGEDSKSTSHYGDEELHRDGEVYDDDEDLSDEDEDEDDQEMDDGEENLDNELKLPAATDPASNNGNSNTVAAGAPTHASIPASIATFEGGSSAVAAKRLQPMPNLRMPSEQTPGRPVVTERPVRTGAPVEPARVLYFDAPPTSLQLPPMIRQQAALQQSFGADPNHLQAAAQGLGSQVAPVAGDLRGARDGAHLMTETRTNQAVPNQAIQGQRETLDDDEESNFKIPSWVYVRLSSSTVWFVILLLLQACFQSIWIHPIMSTVTWTSKGVMLMVKRATVVSSKQAALHPLNNASFVNVTQQMGNTGHAGDKLLGETKAKRARAKRNGTKGKDSSEKPTLTVPKPKLPPKKRTVIKYIPPEPNPNVGKLSDLTEQLDQVLVDADVKALSLEIAIAAAREKINQRKSELLAWSSALTAGQMTLQHLAERESRLESTYLTHGRQSIENVQSSSKAIFDTSVMNATALSLWNVTIQNCTPVNLAQLADALVSTDELETTLDRLRENTSSSVAAAMQDSMIIEKVRVWLQSRVSQEMKLNETAVEFLDKLAAERGVGLSLKSIQAGIQSRLEIERADHNGHVDYASVGNGAVVVRKGMRATSPSFVDSLPLINRLMHYSGFRFYGHGPEAALTSTFPPDALGQCWAMENSAKGNCPDPFCGTLGTLTIRFPKPVQVSGLIVEHPSKRSSDSSSAVRSFRVTGFDEKRAWPFGSFTYDISKLLNSRVCLTSASI